MARGAGGYFSWRLQKRLRSTPIWAENWSRARTGGTVIRPQTVVGIPQRASRLGGGVIGRGVATTMFAVQLSALAANLTSDIMHHRRHSGMSLRLISSSVLFLW